MEIQRSLSVEADIRRVRMAAVALLVGAGIVIGSSAVVHAEACPNEALRAEQPHASQLPDCRAYEQVSPVDKNGIDAVGQVNQVAVSSAGPGVSFFSVAPLPGTVGSAQIPTYLSLRSPITGGWSTEGDEPLLAPGAITSLRGDTDDFAKTIIEVGEFQTLPCEPALQVCAQQGDNDAYVRDNATGSFQLLASNLGMSNGLLFAGATPGGSHILFETSAKLVTTNVPPEPGSNLYEWDEAKPPSERVSLVGVLPGGEAAKGGSFAGAGTDNNAGPARAYKQNAISQDGSRVFFGDAEISRLYMREPHAQPAPVTLPVSPGPATSLAATPDGHYLFYSEGEELYRFNADTHVDEPLTTGAKGIIGTLGASDDGSYIYFVAPGKLVANENANKETAVEGEPNLYEWHNAATTFIARLTGGDNEDWSNIFNTNEASGRAGGERSARVTPDGTTVLFSATAQLTGYHNAGAVEFYLFDARRPASENPVCVSCDPLSTPPTGQVRLERVGSAVELKNLPFNAFLPNNLSSDGTRVYFQTEAALVPEDENNQLDVYEWERQGAGACEPASPSFHEADDGCLYLLSTGQSSAESYFANASAAGSDVYFFTRQSLVSQDHDQNADLYDARIDGGIPAQNPTAPAPPCSQEAGCRETFAGTPPGPGSPSSTTLPPPGNLSPPPPPKPKTAAQLRAEKLTKALRACRKGPKPKRRHCEATARKRYSGKPKAKKSTRGANS